MVVCPNGSAPQAGAPDYVVITNDYMASILPPQLAWLRPFLPYIPPLRFSTGEFCAEDPPGYPDMSLVEWVALVAGSPIQASQEAGRQTAQALYNVLWYQLCECLIDATPAIPSAPTEPTPLPVFNPPDLVEREPADPCLVVDLTPYTKSVGAGASFAGFLNPAPGLAATTFTLSTTVSASTGNFNVSFEIRHQTWHSPVVTSPVLESWTQGVGTLERTIPFQPDYPSVALYLIATTGTGTRVIDAHAEYFCGSSPGLPLQPCCPPDPEQLAALTRILDMVQLIQRQAVPFAYVYGANHVGLTGNGSIDGLSGLLGVSVDVTTLPDYVGRASGTPSTLYDLGYVTLGTVDGWSSSRRIDHDGTLVLPGAAGVYTSIGYTLAPDVVVAIRELVREP